MYGTFRAMLACVVLARSAIGQGLPDSIPRVFIGISTNTQFVTGSLTLSTAAASFAKFSGTMRLRYDGTNNISSIDELRGADMYQVTNAQEYFARNKDKVKKGFCDEPPLWLAIKQDFQQVRVTILTVVDWRKYDPNGTGLCTSDLYALRDSAGS